MATCFYLSLAGFETRLSIKRIEAKEIGNGFLGLPYDTQMRYLADTSTLQGRHLLSLSRIKDNGILIKRRSISHLTPFEIFLLFKIRNKQKSLILLSIDFWNPWHKTKVPTTLWPKTTSSLIWEISQNVIFVSKKSTHVTKYVCLGPVLLANKKIINLYRFKRFRPHVKGIKMLVKKYVDIWQSHIQFSDDTEFKNYIFQFERREKTSDS